MHGSVPPLFHISSWSGAELSVHMDNFTVISSDVFVAVIMKIVVFWVVTTCSFVGAYRVRTFAPTPCTPRSPSLELVHNE
jgi:hypothetical protein